VITIPALVLLLSVAGSVLAQAQDSTPAERFAAIPWQEGGTGRLGSIAEVKVPAGCRFTGKAGTQTFLELTENPWGETEEGTIACRDSSGTDSHSFFIIFTFDDMGYVKDDERDELDADAMLKSMQEGTKQGNEERSERGWATLTLVGWDQPPFYDTRTNNLTWATRLRASDADSDGLNHSVRLLGRGGVMSVDLVMGPDEKAAALPVLDEIVAGFTYLPGQRYAEWRTGDKVAAVGLTGLVVGGAGAIAAKTGLLGKLGKMLVAAGKAALVALIAVGAWLKKKFFNSESPSDQPRA
jgi:uncharacterized membrane-anchored protein